MHTWEMSRNLSHTALTTGFADIEVRMVWIMGTTTNPKNSIPSIQPDQRGKGVDVNVGEAPTHGSWAQMLKVQARRFGDYTDKTRKSSMSF